MHPPIFYSVRFDVTRFSLSLLRAMSRDPTVHPDPDKFIPERFLDTGAGVRSPDSYQFGFGRRYGVLFESSHVNIVDVVCT